MFKPAERNFNNIQFAKLRKKVDKEFNDIHDELSECYYDKKPYKNYGILNKEKFDELHGAIFVEREKKLNKEK